MRNTCFLIVDDSELVLGMVRKVIEMKFGPKRIIDVSNIQDAVDALTQDNIDMVVCSWNMPQSGGQQLLDEMKKDDRWRHIPFIMMTSDSHPGHIIDAVQRGITNYIIKPFTSDELEDKIKRSWQTINKRRAERFNVLSEHRALLKVNGIVTHAAIVNISKTGILIRMEYLPGLNLFEVYKLFLSPESVSSQ